MHMLRQDSRLAGGNALNSIRWPLTSKMKVNVTNCQGICASRCFFIIRDDFFHRHLQNFDLWPWKSKSRLRAIKVIFIKAHSGAKYAITKKMSHHTSLCDTPFLPERPRKHFFWFPIISTDIYWTSDDEWRTFQRHLSTQLCTGCVYGKGARFQILIIRERETL